MKYAIITGTSRGVGEKLARQLLQKNVTVFAISRTKNEALEEVAKEAGSSLYSFNFDLQHVHEIEALVQDIFSIIPIESASSVWLINNAGMLAPMKPIERSDTQEMIQNVQVNLVAPMLFTSSFLKRTNDAHIDKRIINISSGAGKKPYFGWGAYCTTKAGIDMFTRCVAVEEEGKDNPTKIISFAPGVVDTTMQAQIRSTSKEDFIQLDRFLALKEEGQLLSPDYVAQAITYLLETEEFEQGGIVRIDEK
ncbi:(S)-benzoin forming benzil reductase [Microbacteriaceae bacterium 4G12]